MSILKDFRNPWEAATEVLKTSVLDSKVLETKVLETGVLEGSVLGDIVDKLTSKNALTATIHATWWGERFAEYAYLNADSPNPQRLFGIILQGALFSSKAEITQDLLTEYGSVEAVKDYRTKNWGSKNDYPITLSSSFSTKEVMKTVKEKGEFRINVVADQHDAYDYNISGKKGHDGKTMLGSIIVKEVKGYKDTLQGIQYWSMWFSMESPFGKIARGSGIFRKDPWLGYVMTDDDKVAITFDGAIDLITIGMDRGGALLNQALNIAFQILANSQLAFEEQEMVRKIIDIILGYKDADSKVVLNIEDKIQRRYAIVCIVANLIQLGILSYNYAEDKFKPMLPSALKDPSRYEIFYELP